MKQSKINLLKSDKEYDLTNENIQKIIDDIDHFLSQYNITKQTKLWLTLSLEEILLTYQDQKEEGRKITYSLKKRFGSVLCEIFVTGSKLDALQPEINSKISESNIIDHVFNIGPSDTLYQYKDGVNVFSSSIPVDAKKFRFPGNSMLHAVVLGVIIGLLFKQLPPDVITAILDKYVSPVYSTFMGALKGITEPVIFITLIVGICALDDLYTLSNVGKKIIVSFLKVSTIMFILGCATCMFAFNGAGTSSTSFDPSSILSLLLTSVPTNIISPFVEGNMIQIVILGLLCGLVLLILGEKTSTIKKVVVEFKFFFFSILTTFVRLLPFVVFLSVIKVILSVNISDSMIIWKIILIDQFLDIVLAIVLLIYTSIKHKVSINTLFKKMSSMVSVSFTTGSSTATIPEFYKSLPVAFGIDEKFVNYWVPLSNSFFSPSTIFALIVYAFFAAQTQAVSLSVAWIIILYIMIIQIGMATPRIPGGIMASVTILFSQLNLNTEQLGIIMAANVIILYLDTAVASITRCTCAINTAVKEGYCNLDILRDPSIK